MCADEVRQVTTRADQRRCDRETAPVAIGRTTPRLASEMRFFVGPRGKPVSKTALRFLPRHPEKGRYRPKRGRRPRVHDLRGSFAVHRLLRWYEQNANLEAKLPLLVTYLGHVSLHGSSATCNLPETFSAK